MKFNIVIIRPKGYLHSSAFDEIAQLLYYSFCDLGHSVTISENKIDTGAINVVFGGHLLPEGSINQFPDDSIFFNTEQVSGISLKTKKKIYFISKKFKTWDYSSKNKKEIQSDISVIPIDFQIGYHENLNKINNNKFKEFDILFYGSMNARRAEILNRIKEKGLIVKHLFGIYGPERDDYISRSKLVMNIHFYESQIQEIIRLFYLASNSIPILSENNSTTKQEAQWCDAIPSATYHNLVDECFHMIHSETQLCTIGADIHSRISEFPQRIFTEKALEATFK